MIFKYAPGELKNLPGYESAGDGGEAKLGGFDAYQIGATYVKDGAKRLIAQKTVVIPAKDGSGTFVLQLNAGGTEDQIGAVDGCHDGHRRTDDDHALTGSNEFPSDRGYGSAARCRATEGDAP